MPTVNKEEINALGAQFIQTGKHLGAVARVCLNCINVARGIV